MATNPVTGHTGETTRRVVLGSIGSATVLGLAGCLGDDDDSETTDREETPTGDESADEEDEPDRAAIEFDHPEAVVLDEPFSVEIRDIPVETVEVEASLTDSRTIEWVTHATYETTDGRLDLETAKPVDASVDVDVIHDEGTMGLVGYAEPTAGSSAGYWPQPGPGDEVTLSVEHDGEMLAETTIDRTYGDTTWERIDSEAFVGWLSEPPGDEPGPGVLVLHGSEGNPARHVAQMLAANGFVALALQYFDPSGSADRIPDRLVEVPLEFVETSAEWVLEHDRVEGEQVGAWGVSKGGELALLSGSRFGDIGAVVSMNGSGYVWQGVDFEQQHVASSWAADGEPVSYVPYTTDPDAWDTSQPPELRRAYSSSVEDADEKTLEDATIPVEDIDGPVLLVSGGDDRLWNSVELHGVAAERLDEHDRQYTHLVYEAAGHLIQPPYLPGTGREEDEFYVYGGSTAGHSEADRDHWPQVLETFQYLSGE